MIAIFAGCFLFAILVGVMLGMGIDPAWGLPIFAILVFVALVISREVAEANFQRGMRRQYGEQVRPKRRDS